MSAFQVSPEHINYLVHACQRYDASGHIYAYRDYQGRPDDLGNMLARVNAESVNARYAHHNDPCAPIPYRWSMRTAVPLSPIQVIKACDCYRYQSCEHPDWPGSQAEQIIEQLRERAITLLAGYDEAEWEIEAA